jgi:MoaA/NifB/PqqE/SkfB family radical SAM enzyme
MGIVNVLFTGGEPLIRQDFPVLLKYADDIGLVSSCRSNGSLLNNDLAEMISGLKNFRSMCLSLDGPTSDSNDLLRHPGSFQGVIQAAHLLINRGIPTYLETTFNSDNINFFEEFLIITKTLNANGLVARALVPAGRGKHAKKKCPDLQQLLAIIENFNNNGHRYNVEIKTPCILSEGSLCKRMVNIKSNGAVSYCYLIRDNLVSSVFEIDGSVFKKEVPCIFRNNFNGAILENEIFPWGIPRYKVGLLN